MVITPSRLFALAGVDYVQWKAVSRTLLRGDFRPPTLQNSGAYSTSREMPGSRVSPSRNRSRLPGLRCSRKNLDFCR